MTRPPIPPIELSDAAADALMPLPVHGWVRRTCENVWWLVGILWGVAVTDALTTKHWSAWGLVIALGLMGVFMTTVRFDNPARTGRQVFMFAAGWTVGTAVMFAALAGYAVWVAGMA